MVKKLRAASPSALDRVNVARLTAYLRGQFGLDCTSILFDQMTRSQETKQKEAVDNFFKRNLVAKRSSLLTIW